ncbi:UNVERIFIED_CONTAM: hypothetical protein GTU68_021847 [Idotea baltica]|nr:hypothetical protein [Idotea baltica]
MAVFLGFKRDNLFFGGHLIHDLYYGLKNFMYLKVYRNSLRNIST